MNEDYVFLLLIIVAVVFMVAIYAIGVLSPLPTTVGEAEYLEEFTMGTVGFVSQTPAKTFSLGNLELGEPQKENLKSLPIMDISASWFGGDSKKYTINVDEWYFDTMENLSVSFSVDNTNMYADLFVVWNGQVFFQSQAHPRTYRVKIAPQYVEEVNTLEVYTAPPGLMFWASSTYQLRDFSVDLEYGPAKLYSFELFTNEIQSFRKGSFDFYGTGTGHLTAKVNGVEIYSSVPLGIENAEFTFSDIPLNVGDNIFSLSSVGNVQLFDAELNVYLLLNEVTRQKDFELSVQQYDSLEYRTHRGRVDFNVREINEEGALKITLNGRSLDPYEPVQGSNTVYFYMAEAREGENKLDFSSTGSYSIGEVKIGLEKA